MVTDERNAARFGARHTASRARVRKRRSGHANGTARSHLRSNKRTKETSSGVLSHPASTLTDARAMGDPAQMTT